MSVKKLGVLISGGGTNLQAIIDSIKMGEINGQVVVIISDNNKAYGLERGKKEGIRTEFIDYKALSPAEYNKRILEILHEESVDLVVLAGYLKVLGKEIIEDYKNRIINIHPSLIPSFCGKGFYGEKVHKAVLEKGVKLTGVTVHFVDEGTDTGEILLQEAVEVLENDTVDSLQQRVLKVEHRLLIKAIKMLCE